MERPTAVRGECGARIAGWIAATTVVALVALGLIFRGNIAVYYYSLQMKRPKANRLYCMNRMVEAGPFGTRRVLQLCRDGSYDGDIEQISAAILADADHDVYEYVLPLLSDPDPAVRGYAAHVAGHLGDKRYLPALAKLTKDKTPLPAGWFDETVADRAKTALGWIRSGVTRRSPRAGNVEEATDDLTTDPLEE